MSLGLVDELIESIDTEDVIDLAKNFISTVMHEDIGIAAIRKLVKSGVDVKALMGRTIVQSQNLPKHPRTLFNVFKAAQFTKEEMMQVVFSEDNPQSYPTVLAVLLLDVVSPDDFLNALDKYNWNKGGFITSEVLKELSKRKFNTPWKKVFEYFLYNTNFEVNDHESMKIFLENGITADEIIDVLFGRFLIVHTRDELMSDLVLKSKDPQDILEKVLKQNARQSFDYQELLKDPRIDTEFLYKHLLKTRNYVVILDQLDSLVERGINVDLSEYVGDILHSLYLNKERVVKLLTLKASPSDIIETLVKRGALNQLSGYEHLFEGKVQNLEGLFEAAFRGAEEAGHINIVVQFCKLGLKKVDVFKSLEPFKKEIDMLFLVQDVSKLKYLVQLDLVDANDPRFETLVKSSQVKMGEMSEDSKVEKRESFGEVDVTSLTAEFYLYQAIRERIGYIKDSPSYGNLDSNALRKIESILFRAKALEKRVFSFLQEYTLHAVCSELNHARTLRRYPIGKLNYSPSTMWENYSQTELLNFFNTASRIFCLDIFPGDNFGGPKWSQIARAGYDLMAQNDPSVELCDFIFSLEHNSGDYFDKDHNRIKREKRSFKRLLDDKFSATSSTELLDRMIHYIDAVDFQVVDDLHLVNKLISGNRL